VKDKGAATVGCGVGPAPFAKDVEDSLPCGKVLCPELFKRVHLAKSTSGHNDLAGLGEGSGMLPG
jgi:hypothetical protein